MTAVFKPVTAGQQLVYSAIATVEVLEQALALQKAIKTTIYDNQKQSAVRLEQVEQLATIAMHLLAEATDALETDLAAITNTPTIISER